MQPLRMPWKAGFPDVLIVADEPAVKRHPDFHAAKTGNPNAAARLVQAMVPEAAIERMRTQVAGRVPILVSVHAAEAQGINAIPEALADLLAQRLGLRTDETLVQINVVNHTGAGGKVIGALALTGKPFSAKMALSAGHLQALRSKHGHLEDWWREHFGFGFDALTQSEARYLERTADAHTIRDRIAAAQQTADGSHRQGDSQ